DRGRARRLSSCRRNGRAYQSRSAARSPASPCSIYIATGPNATCHISSQSRAASRDQSRAPGDLYLAARLVCARLLRLAWEVGGFAEEHLAEIVLQQK